MTLTLDQAANQQPIVGKRSPLSLSNRTTIAQVLTWDMHCEVSADEIITLAIVNGIVQIKLTDGRAALLSVDTFKLILQQQRQQMDEDVAYVERLEQRLEKDAASYELDRSGQVYRVWQGINLLGTFYRLGRNWVAEPANTEPIDGLRSADAAQKALICVAKSARTSVRAA